MAAQFDLKLSKNAKHFFTLTAANGEVILTSQMYASRAGARKGIASVQGNAEIRGRYEERKGTRGKMHFVLKAGNHRVIGTSQVYSTPKAMEKGIKSVQKNGKAKKVVIGEGNKFKKR